MIHALTVAVLGLLLAPAAQDLSVLHIKVVLIDAGGNASPVPRHALLISDNPATSAPRRVVTALNGTADVRLRPGNYTVESDRPVVFEGKAYQWVRTLDVPAGRETTLELAAGNADVEAATAELAAAGSSIEADASAVLMQWQDAVVGLWTPTRHASAFVVDGQGVLATSSRVVGSASTVEVQLTPALKVAGRVIAVDAERDVAVLWIDPRAGAPLRPAPLACDQARPAVSSGQELVAIGAPLRQLKALASGTVSRVEPRVISSNLTPPSGGAGGPVFAAGGVLVGMTSIPDDTDDRLGRAARIVRIEEVCAAVAAAAGKMKDATPPSGAPLPLEPARPFPVAALEAAAKRRAGSISPYQMSSADFEIAFMTPVQVYGARYQAQQTAWRERGGGGRSLDAPFVRPLLDFSNWSDYMSDVPPVIAIRVTPKFEEAFWTKMARGAARTQGMDIPAIKRFGSGFSRLRAFCGETEVTPIHPFKLEHRVSETSVIYEGLYLFDPAALIPACGTVKLVVYSEKEPDKADSRPVDPKILQQLWDDFAPYRG